MEFETVKAIARFVRGAQIRDPQLSVVWHAGEPLTIPIAFYETALHILQCDAAPMPFRHNFQTSR
jgi:uncharacterized protein